MQKLKRLFQINSQQLDLFHSSPKGNRLLIKIANHQTMTSTNRISHF